MPRTLTQLKQAAAGSRGDDGQFEQTFAEMAHVYVRDTVPSLFKYEVGFQLIDRDDAGTKAAGVLAFKAGEHWIFAPVFFRDGDLKGNCLLWLRDAKMFVPATEEWASFLSTRSGARLGNAAGRDAKRQDSHWPDLFSALRAPFKFATAVDGEIAKEAAAYRAGFGELSPRLAAVDDDMLVGIGRLALRAVVEPATDDLQLPGFLSRRGVKYASRLLRLVDRYPTLRPALDVYGEKLAAAFESLRRRPEGTGARPRPTRTKAKLAFVRFDGFDPRFAKLLTPAEKTAAATKGYTLVDGRVDEETAKLLAVGDMKTMNDVEISTPGESGLYEVVTRGGDRKRVLLSRGAVGPRADGPNAPWLAIVPGASAKWGFVRPESVWVEADTDGMTEWRTFVRDKGDKSPKTGNWYVALTPDGKSTLPFKITKSLGAGGAGERIYEATFAMSSAPGPSKTINRHERDGHLRLRCTNLRTIVLTDGDVCVPDDAALLSLAAKTTDDATDLGFAAKRDVENGLLTKVAIENGGYHRIVAERSGRFILDDERLDRVATIERLVVRHNAREKAAAALVELAESRPTDPVGFLVKRAASSWSPRIEENTTSPPDIEPTPAGATGYFGPNVDAFPVTEEERPSAPATIPEPMTADDYLPPDPAAAKSVADAVQTGQRDVIDTSLIGALLQDADEPPTGADVGAIAGGVDAIGHRLFSYYWRPEAHASRMGSAKTKEYEMTLRSAFGELGKVLLHLLRTPRAANVDDAARTPDKE